MKIDRKTCITVGVSIFILYLCIHYWPAVAGVIGALIGACAPLFIGCAIAYIVNILMSFYERHLFKRAKKRASIRARRGVCMLLAFLTVLAIAALVIGLVVPEFVACISLLISKIPDAVDTAASWLSGHALLSDELAATLASIDWATQFEQILAALKGGIGNVVGTVFDAVVSVFSGIVTAFLAFVFALYILSGKERLGDQARRVMARYLKENVYRRALYILSVLDDCFHRYIVGQCVEAVILGALCTLGMLLLGMPYATMIGALVALTALIPVAGAYIGAGVGAFMILTVSPVQALIFLAFLIILQQLEGNLIYPRVVGSQVGLPAIWVLAAVAIGGGVLGIGGMFLGVPIAAAGYRLLKEDVQKKTA